MCAMINLVTQEPRRQSLEIRPQVRVIVSLSQVGTSGVAQALANHPEIYAHFSPISSQQRNGGRCDFSVLGSGHAPHPRHHQHPDCTHVVSETIPVLPMQRQPVIFPDNASVGRTRPLFLFPDPLSAFASIKPSLGAEGLTVSGFCRAYISLYELYRCCLDVSAETGCLSVTQLAHAPEATLRRLCSNWEIAFNPAMLAQLRPLSMTRGLLSADEGRCLNRELSNIHRDLNDRARRHFGSA